LIGRSREFGRYKVEDVERNDQLIIMWMKKVTRDEE